MAWLNFIIIKMISSFMWDCYTTVHLKKSYGLSKELKIDITTQEYLMTYDIT